MRGFSAKALTRRGYRVIEAETAEEALQLLDGGSFRIDLLLTDVVLPGKSGKDLAAECRSLAPQAKVLFCSGYTGRLVTQSGRLPEGSRLLQKPYDASTLVCAVRAALDDETH